MKRIIILLLLASILVPLQIDAATPNAPASVSGDTIVNIPDANLRAAINQRLYWKQVDGTRQGCTATDAITRTEMQRLTVLTARRRDIRDLTGLEHATNLRGLRLDVNRISAITPLAGLTNLISLTLRNTFITQAE